MTEIKETNSGAAAETCIAISVKDMEWIERTKGEQSKKARLSEVITLYRRHVAGEKV